MCNKLMSYGTPSVLKHKPFSYVLGSFNEFWFVSFYGVPFLSLSDWEMDGFMDTWGNNV